jgi:stage III sporulation protein AB
MKWLFYVLLVAGCGGSGFLMAGRLNRRAQLLRELRLSFQTLQTRIQYFSDPLQRAFRESADFSPLPIKAFYLSIADRMREGCDLPGSMAYALMEIEKTQPLFGSLLEKDSKALSSFSKSAGSDSNTQQASFGFIDGYIEGEIIAAERRIASHGRLYRASGLLVGFLLIVLFW